MTNNLIYEDVYLTGLLSLPFVVLSETYKITARNEIFWMIKSILDTKRHIYAHFRLFKDQSIIKNNLFDIINLYNIHGLQIKKDIINLNNIQELEIKRNIINLCKKRGLEIKNGIINLINIQGLEIKNDIINLCKTHGLEIENECSNTKDKNFFYIDKGTTFRELTTKKIHYVNYMIKTNIHIIREKWIGLPNEYMKYFEYHLKNWYKFLQLRQPIPNPELLTVEMQNIRDNKLYLMYFDSLPMVHWWEVQINKKTLDPTIQNIFDSLRNICCHANANYEEKFIDRCLRMVRYLYNHYGIKSAEVNHQNDCFRLIGDVDFHKLNIETNVLCIPITDVIKEELSNLITLKDYLQKFVNRISYICPTFIDQLALI